MRFTPIDVEANVRARIVLVRGGRYRFSGIKAILMVRSKKDDLMVARRCADHTVTYCHLTGTVGRVVPMTVKSRARAR